MTGMRIWHQSMAPLDEFAGYAKLLEEHVASVVSPGTEVVLHGSRPGSYLGLTPAELLRFPYARHLVARQALDFCAEAESEGYDAFAFATFGDPFLVECRSLVDIPVVSMVESTLHVARSLADRIALVVLTPRSRPRVVDMVRRMGLEDRIASVTSLEPPVTEKELLAICDRGGDDAFVAGFEQVARRAIDEGADLVVPAEGVFNEVL